MSQSIAARRAIRTLGVTFVLALSACAGAKAARHEAGEPTPRESPLRLAPTPQSERILCDRVVDDFRAGAEGEFPTDWETYPSSSLELAKRERLFRVVTLDGTRALHASSGDEEITLGRAIDDWDLETYPFVEWSWRPARRDLPTRFARTEEVANGVASVSAVWMIGLPFFVRRLGYTLGSHEPEGTLRAQRFGYDKWLTVDSATARSESLSTATWHTVRVDLLSDYRRSFERTDGDDPTGLALTTNAAGLGARTEAYFTNIRLCRRESSRATSGARQQALP